MVAPTPFLSEAGLQYGTPQRKENLPHDLQNEHNRDKQWQRNSCLQPVKLNTPNFERKQQSSSAYMRFS